uniref:F5/8 type C domain-containing protein n=1 Tax=Panagrellus redivivus TaxID=6233 RepID=A0A7E4VJG0_PANRE
MRLSPPGYIRIAVGWKLRKLNVNFSTNARLTRVAFNEEDGPRDVCQEWHQFTIRVSHSETSFRPVAPAAIALARFRRNKLGLSTPATTWLPSTSTKETLQDVDWNELMMTTNPSSHRITIKLVISS